MTKDRVADLVQERLRSYHPGGVDIAVVEEDIRLRDDCWYVPVRPSAQPRRTFEYYEALADVETELSEQEDLNVWLVPTMPDEEPQVTSAGGSSIP